MVDQRRGLVRSPYFDELDVGRVFDAAPAVTLTDGMQATHSAIVGNRFPLALDRELAAAVAGRPVVSPALAWDVSIGQSTPATQHVRANLFYRGLCFSRLPSVGDTLRTRTTVEALRENSRRPGRPPTGLAVLRITTVDQERRTVLDYRRCAMLLLSPGAPETGRRDEIARAMDLSETADVFASTAGWDLGELRGSGRRSWQVGDAVDVMGGDVVSSAPELARLTGNVARVHHDAIAAGGARLVYGGHAIGLAFHHLCQAMPEIVTVAGWHGCDHVGPVHEGDLLVSRVAVETVLPGESGATALGLRVSTSRRPAAGADEKVLVWRPVVIVA